MDHHGTVWDVACKDCGAKAGEPCTTGVACGFRQRCFEVMEQHYTEAAEVEARPKDGSHDGQQLQEFLARSGITTAVYAEACSITQLAVIRCFGQARIYRRMWEQRLRPGLEKLGLNPAHVTSLHRAYRSLKLVD